MDIPELVVATLAGVVQGIVEWLPVSSQGNLSMFLTVVGVPPETALQLALFLQVGTTVSSAVYYRDDIEEAATNVPEWRPGSAFENENALTSFVLVACVATAAVGIPVYVYAVDVASELAGSVFVAGIGALLILTGILQLASARVDLASKEDPTFADAMLVGAVQGLAILPGVSRSGVTTSVLLFRNHETPSAFRLSFLLSIPAGLGAGVLTVLSAGGLPGVSPAAAGVALLTSAVVGYLTIDALMTVVERVPFWAVCFGLGGLATVGGLVVAVL
ncbi:undecaprenyl-diphosphate phosphatase [Haloarchaeobius sp. HRN-SO-5]|uniref:undecaprenyl-diphosphate phosphatase n=1 Tax=Haloarchaeobius sp. HRN-SO-5 TaxID=3446118 RepID=UPI003EBEDFDF